MTETTTAPATGKRATPSSLALKQVMALTGIVFVAFVVVHMIGNLKVYQGPEAFDGYAAWLREVGYPLVPRKGVLWALRVTLLVALVAHVWAAVVLWLRGRRHRGAHRRRTKTTKLAHGAATMLPGGGIILLFVVVHLLDLTIGALVSSGTFRHPDGQIHAYANLVASFSRPWMAIFYVLSMVVIGLHVLHGWRTVLQDVGVTGARTRAVWTTVGALIALAIVVGNALIPILVLAGVIA